MECAMKETHKQVIVQLVIILVIGLLSIGLFWLAYAGIYLALESLLFPNDPTALPTDLLRWIASISVFVLYIGLLFMKVKPFIKAVASIAPNAVIMIAIVLAYYSRPFIFLLLVAVFVAIQVIIMINRKVAWYFYTALGYSTFLGLLYAWPRA